MVVAAESARDVAPGCRFYRDGGWSHGRRQAGRGLWNIGRVSGACDDDRADQDSREQSKHSHPADDRVSASLIARVAD